VEAPPEFSSLPLPVRVQLAGLGPLLLGAVGGFLLGESETGYWVVQALGALGGFAGGMEHSNGREAALRGLAAGTLFGLGLVGAHALTSDPIVATAPSPLVLIVLFTAAFGTGLAALGSWVRRGGEQPNG
jgi:hypothetical protein